MLTYVLAPSDPVPAAPITDGGDHRPAAILLSEMIVPERVPGAQEDPRFAWGARRRAALELLALVTVIILYSWLHNLAGTDISHATANAYTFQRIEGAAGLNIELAVNHWLAGSPVLPQIAMWCYRLYYLPLAGVLLWVLFRHPVAYRRVRVTLIVMAAIALVVFWLLPVSPPRFALPGIVDVVAEYDVVGGAASRDLSNGTNHFSAFPSMHVAWSALCAYAAWMVLRGTRRSLAVLVWLFPLGMIAVVVTTGNHYVLDVAGSAVLFAVALAATVAYEHVSGRGTGPTRRGDPSRTESMTQSSSVDNDTRL